MIDLEVSKPKEDALRAISRLCLAAASASTMEVKQIVISVATILEAYVDFTVGGPQRDWRQRKRLYKRSTGIDLVSGATGEATLSVIDLRNAIAHGSGGLSPNQRNARDGGYSVRVSIERHLGTQFDRDRIVFGSQTSFLAIRAGHEFIAQLVEPV